MEATEVLPVDVMPLVVVPGIGSDGYVFSTVPDVIVVQPSGSTVEAMAAALLDAAPPRFAVAGHSMGGYVALAAYVMDPARIDRLALISTTATPDTPAQRAARLSLIAEAEQDFERVVQRLSRAMVHRDRWSDDQMMEGLCAMLRRQGPATLVQHLRAALDRPDPRRILPVIHAPVLVLTGSDDRIIDPVHSAALSEAIPGSHLVTIRACGHVPTIEQPDATLEALHAWWS